MSAYEPNSRHLWEVLIFCFNMKKYVAEAHRMLSNTYGEASISEKTCRELFQRFKNGDFDVEDQHGIWWDQLGVVYYELNSPGASSDKESGSIKSVDAKSTHSLMPSVVLNSAGSSVSSLQNALNSKESPEKDSDNQYQLLDTGSNMSPGSISQESSLFPDNLSRSSESGKSIDLGLQKTPDTSSSKTDITRSEKLKSTEKKEKKKSSWYNMLNPTYKSRSDDFKRLFKDLPDSERLIVGEYYDQVVLMS
ncbi:GRAM domain-containing protein 1B [Trichonephila clavipes]|nr:GRAM domain-containing protein 1B [Trichonephila clavipes]